ncbi:MAG: hypothetical protein QXN62_06680 [Candidatus Bathyarchaeia archaeon]|nr:hypothetical protein [Candidatus Bathyarchaeota archaeon]
MVDLVGPLITSFIILFEVFAVLVEAALIYLLLEKKAAKALTSSFIVNLVTGLLNLVYFFFSWADISTYHQNIIIFAVALLINILVEASILKYLYKPINVKKILKVSTIMNLASFIILVFFIVYG